jgi:hypothetical protein
MTRTLRLGICALALVAGGVARGEQPTLIARQSARRMAVDDWRMVWSTVDAVSELEPSGAVSHVSNDRAAPLALDQGVLYLARKDGIWRRLWPGAKWVWVATLDDGPVEIAVDHKHVYWASPHGSIHRAPKTGGASKTLATVDALTMHFAVDGLHVYFSAIGPEGHHAVMRVPVTGGKPEVVGELFRPGRLALDGPYVYATCEATGTPGEGNLVRLLKDGGPKQRPQVIARGLHQLWDLFVDGRFVYLLVQEDQAGGGDAAAAGAVARVDKEGGTPTVLAGGQHDLWAMVHDRENVYWSASDGVWSLPLTLQPACSGALIDLDAIERGQACGASPRKQTTSPPPDDLSVRLEPDTVTVRRGGAAALAFAFVNRTAAPLTFRMDGVGEHSFRVEILDSDGKPAGGRDCIAFLRLLGYQPIKVELAPGGRARKRIEVSARPTIVPCPGSKLPPLQAGTYRLRVHAPLPTAPGRSDWQAEAVLRVE